VTKSISLYDKHSFNQYNAESVAVLVLSAFYSLSDCLQS